MRLELLYRAGLFEVASLLDAEPEEVAQVTGMSPLLARAIIHAAMRFDSLRRQGAARALFDRTRDTILLAREAHRASRSDPALLFAMRCAQQELTEALRQLKEMP